jgi:hypothetical protein
MTRKFHFSRPTVHRNTGDLTLPISTNNQIEYFSFDEHHSVPTDCERNATTSEDNINIKWFKYSAIPFKDGFLYSETQFYMEYSEG